MALTPALIEAILGGTAGRCGLSVPAGWPDEHDAGFLRSRQAPMLVDPGLAQWVRAVVVAGDGPVRVMVGHAGFHGPPGVNGAGAADALEIGYTIFPDYRGRGYATAAAAALIEWAGHEHGIRRFIASVAPDNAPSLAVVARLGFRQAGEQWDEEDGLELVYERYLPALPAM